MLLSIIVEVFFAKKNQVYFVVHFMEVEVFYFQIFAVGEDELTNPTSTKWLVNRGPPQEIRVLLRPYSGNQ